VPFRPVVLHQWVVALLAEALKFELKISDLLTLDSPVALHPHIEKLREMHNVLHFSSHSFLQYFMLFCRQQWVPKSEMELQFQQFPNLLPVLKFVLSSECNDIIMSLKRMSWNPNSTRRSCQLGALPDCLMRTFDYSHLYSQLFWLDRNEKLVLFVNSEQIQRISLATLLAEDSHSQPIRSSDIHALCRFVDEKIIKTGRIGGVHSDLIFAAVNISSNILCKLYKFYNKYIGEIIFLFFK
jgi:hypothetical protein